jgi:hypothetical protein
MATMISEPGVDLESFCDEIRAMANWQYQCPQSQRLYSVPLNVARARVWTVQMVLWTLNRRDCWAFTQGAAPMDVKKLIWEHEEDELAGNKECGVADHYSLAVKASEVLGLTPEDFSGAEPHIGTRTCCYAWLHLVKNSHWLKSLSACAALEVSNSSDWVEGGGNSFRRRQRFHDDLGIPLKKMTNETEHVEVDVIHGELLIEVFKRHVKTPEDQALMLEGARETWEIERVWKGQVADMLEEVPGPS